jgi:hypothetical protein
MAPARPGERRRDAVALALLVAGALLFLYAYRGMQELAAGHFAVAPGELAVRRWAHFRDLSYAGMALAAIGVGVAVWSYWRRAHPPAEPGP